MKKAMGRREGREEGRLEGKILAYLDVGFTLEAIADKINIPIEKVTEVFENAE